MRNLWRCAAALAAVLWILGTPGAAANIAAHPAYLAGFADGTLRPDAPLTREQLAQILYRLLPRDALPDKPRAAAYVDVAANRWSYRAVCALTQLGVWEDARQPHFDPQRQVTGAEFAETLRRAGAYLPELALAAADEPDADVTRAQAARMLNALLDRTGETLPEGLLHFCDATAERPDYADLCEAANPHCVMPDGTWDAVG